MGRTAAVVALLLAVCAAAAPAGTEPERVYALLSESPPGMLAEVDARTLKPVSSARVELGRLGRWSFSPDGDELAVSTGWVPRSGVAAPVQLRFVDLVKLRLTGSVRLGPDPRISTGYMDPVVLISWLTPDIVVAVRQRPNNRGLELVGVDAGKRSVRWRRPLSGVILASATVGGELALLVGKEGKIVAPRLLVVGPDGSIRSTELSRLRAGWSWENGNPPRGEFRMPGLAVDSAARTAYVAAPSGLIAEIALDGLGVRYHAQRGTFAKYRSGAERQAVSLGEGILVVVGSNSTVEKNAKGELFQNFRGSGLEFVDTRTGARRLVDSGASFVADWHGGLVSAGWSWDQRVSERQGNGLAIFDRAGVLRTRLLAGLPVSLLGVHGDLAYAYVDGDQIVSVDLAAGQVIGRCDKAFPLLR